MSGVGLKLLYTANQASDASKRYIDNKGKNNYLGVAFGDPNVDRILTPGFGGEMWGMAGRPGCGKSNVTNAWARNRANRIQTTQALRERQRKVVYVTGEQIVEELVSFNAAAVSGVNTEAMKRGVLTPVEKGDVSRAMDEMFDWPLWWIGRSAERYHERIPLTVPNIAETLVNAMNEWPIEIDMVVIDYLTALDIRPGSGFTENLIDALVQFKAMAFDLNALVVVNVQAAQDVDKRDIPVPGLGDSEWIRGAGGQKFDTMMSVVRPILYVNEHEAFGSENTNVQEYDLLLNIIKQKVGYGNKPVWMKLDPRYNQLTQAEVRTAIRNGDVIEGWNKPKRGRIDYSERDDD